MEFLRKQITIQRFCDELEIRKKESRMVGREAPSPLKVESLSWKQTSPLEPVRMLSHSVVSDSLWPPRTVAHQAPLSMGILQARILEWGCHALLQGIFSTQGLNPGLPHFRWILYNLSHQGSPWIQEWIAYPSSRGSSQSRNRKHLLHCRGDSLPAEQELIFLCIEYRLANIARQ